MFKHKQILYRAITICVVAIVIVSAITGELCGYWLYADKGYLNGKIVIRLGYLLPIILLFYLFISHYNTNFRNKIKIQRLEKKLIECRKKRDTLSKKMGEELRGSGESGETK